IRNLRAEHKVPAEAKIMPTIEATGATAEALELGKAFVQTLVGARSVAIAASAEPPPGSAVTVRPDCRIIIPLEDVIDRAAELTRLQKEQSDIDRQLGAVRGKLGNEAFVSRAPAAVVEQQRAKE